jgi:hypothetical protein
MDQRGLFLNQRQHSTTQGLVPFTCWDVGGNYLSIRPNGRPWTHCGLEVHLLELGEREMDVWVVRKQVDYSKTLSERNHPVKVVVLVHHFIWRGNFTSTCLENIKKHWPVSLLWSSRSFSRFWSWPIPTGIGPSKVKSKTVADWFTILCDGAILLSHDYKKQNSNQLAR